MNVGITGLSYQQGYPHLQNENVECSSLNTPQKLNMHKKYAAKK